MYNYYTIYATSTSVKPDFKKWYCNNYQRILGVRGQCILFRKNSSNNQSILSQKWKSPLCPLQSYLYVFFQIIYPYSFVCKSTYMWYHITHCFCSLLHSCHSPLWTSSCCLSIYKNLYHLLPQHISLLRMEWALHKCCWPSPLARSQLAKEGRRDCEEEHTYSSSCQLPEDSVFFGPVTKPARSVSPSISKQISSDSPWIATAFGL